MHTGRIVFSQLMDFLPRYEFNRCAGRYLGNYRTRHFKCHDQFLCMAFAQLTGRESLRDIETCLRAMQPKLYHAGIRYPVSRSTLADANENRNWRIYADFAQVLIGHARKLYSQDDFGVQLEETAYVFDSSTIDLCLSLFPWARFRQRKAAIKLHTLMDLRGNIPCFIRITEGKTHDVSLLDELILEPGAFYIMDRGYIDFARLYTFTQQAAFFVIRAKRNLDYTRRMSRPVDKSTGLRSDQTIVLHGPGTSQDYPDGPASHQLLRPRDGEAVRISHQPFRPSRLDHPAVVQMTAGKWNCSSSSNNICKSKRSSAPPRTRSRPRSGSLSALTCSWPSSRSSYTSTAVWPENPANLHRFAVRESRYFTIAYENRLPIPLRASV